MKINKEFILREIEDDILVIPVGKMSDSINGIITLNSTGAFLWKELETEKTKEDLIGSLIKEYDIDTELAEKAVDLFLLELGKINCLE